MIYTITILNTELLVNMKRDHKTGRDMTVTATIKLHYNISFLLQAFLPPTWGKREHELIKKLWLIKQIYRNYDEKDLSRVPALVYITL